MQHGALEDISQGSHTWKPLLREKMWMTTKFLFITHFWPEMSDVTSDITSYVILHHINYGRVDVG